MGPQNAGGIQPYSPIPVTATSSPVIPDRHSRLNCWSIAIPDGAGTYNVVTPANVDVEIANIRFKRGSAGNAADTYSVQRGTGGDVIGVVTPPAAAGALAGAPALDPTFRSVTGGTTIRIVVTDAGGGSDGVLDIFWFQA